MLQQITNIFVLFPPNKIPLLPLHPSPHSRTVIAELFHYSPIYILMILNSYCCHNIGAICKNYCVESFIM